MQNICVTSRTTTRELSHQPLNAEVLVQPTQVYVGFVAGKVALRQYFLSILPFYQCSVHINSSTTHAI
jgi:hypothetical protein